MKSQNSKKWYKRWWVWVIIIIIALPMLAALGGKKTGKNPPQIPTIPKNK